MGTSARCRARCQPSFDLTCWKMLLRCSRRLEQRGSMIDISENERRRAFSIWLRTGRLPSAREPDGIELKFNPWHDPETGRFTFVGAGRHYGDWGGGGLSGGGGGKGGGGGATGSWDQPARPPRAKSQRPARRVTSGEPTRTASQSDRGAAPKVSARRPGTWAGGGFTGGGGGSFGGGGATSTEAWGSPEPKRRPTPSHTSAPTIVSSNRAVATNTVPRELRTHQAKFPARSFATVMRTRSTRGSGRGAFPVCSRSPRHQCAPGRRSDGRVERSGGRATMAAITSQRALTARPRRSTISRRMQTSIGSAIVCWRTSGRGTSVPVERSR